MIIIKEKKLTEFKIQNILFNYCIRKKNHVLGIPNSYIFDWESDFVSVTKSNYVHEYEIKISKADYKQDIKKVSKHKILLEGSDESKICPAYFWYVCPENLIEEVPDYAGLIYIVKGNKPKIIKKAPKLCRSQITEWQQNKVLRGSMWRYWKMREKLDALESKLDS